MKLPETIARWLGGGRSRDEAESLYAALVAQARRPEPFVELGVPDSLDGRFDALCLHMFLLVRRLARDGARGAGLARGLYDSMFADMDRTLREMGVGDLGIGKRVTQMAEGLMGRIKAYGDGLDAGQEQLLAAIGRNLFAGSAAVEPRALERVASYLRASEAALAAQDIDALLSDGPRFADWADVP
ncbi:MAG: ubiquinol-cytochrome C chaperone family protein [Alphaproteobacteria bacterium]